MIRFEEPWVLALALLGLAGWWLFARGQRRAGRWIWSEVDERFWPALTRYTPRNLRPALLTLLILGLLLIVAAARPTLGGGTVRELSGRLVLLLDASSSMYATDALVLDPDGSGTEQRFEQARQIAQRLIAHAPGFEVAVVSFSGVAALELPMTSDRAAVEEALRLVEVHTYYRNTGSSFGGALDRLVHFVEPGRDDLQAVLLSDGEQPFPESYEEALAPLAELRVTIHSVAIGSLQGQERRIFDFRDVLDRKEEKRTLREYHTRRVDEHLEQIAARTGGTFAISSPRVVDDLGAALVRRLESSESSFESTSDSSDESQRRDLSAIFAGLFLIGFLLEGALLRRRPKRPDYAFSIAGPYRRGAGSRRPAIAKRRAVAVLLSLLPGGIALSCGDSPLARARRENRLGIAADTLQQWQGSRLHFERSIGFDHLPEIPTYNLGRSVTRQGDFSEAHDLFQRALELAPDLAEAHDNDGHALFRWGVSERDPRGCRLERTRELWQASRKRFAAAVELYPTGGNPENNARVNHRFVIDKLAEIQGLIDDPPPECLQQTESSSSSASSSAGGGGGEGAEDPSSAGGQNQPSSGDDGQSPQGSGPGEREGGENRQPSGGGEGERDGPVPLTGAEQEEIESAFARIREELLAEGKYYRRTRAEQFPRAAWQRPDPTLWW